ncbi:hypothetical protein [Polyangium sp. 15x6]|uniref:hypothetical protein n=1 Tax=Polyangium sp. 15x6 TaxID=3042687 RepID=UPI00249B1323|nr:hypothetical protein [Polyangium sp. 15x6]MDI3290741.1 hypothetical protein [Polyangium sp. 15x6]
MKQRAVPRAASVALVALAASFAACSAKPERPGASTPPPSPLRPKPAAAPEPLLGPARYVLAEGVGVSFDEAGRDSALPRREPALASGNRFLLDGGLVLAEARGPEALYGFRSLPARLGGGYVFWSEARTYRADTFLGELRPIAQIAAEGGARPWLDTLVLRTDLGLLELDPRAEAPALRRTDLARFAEAFSLDGKHGVRLDAFGRAEITTDGGKTFRDLTAERSVRIFALEEGESGKLLLLTGAGRQPTLALDPAKGLVPVAADPPNDLGWGMMPSVTEDLAAPSRHLAPLDLPSAVFAGARLPGGRALVVREQGLRILALATGQALDVAPLPGVAEPFAQCQPITRGADVLLACTHPHGAHVLALPGDPSAPRLEATFPEPSTFIAGLGQRFAFTGRCGALVPTAADFRGAPPVSDAQPKLFGPSAFEQEFTTPPADPPEPLDPTPPDEAYVCVRGADGAWTERRLTGEDATHLYRFLPGDGGTATALVLRGKDTKTAPRPAPEGVRIIRVDPADPALGGAVFPAAPTPMEESPYRSIDRDFWLDEKDGSIHGWIVLAPEGEDPEDALERDPIPQGRSERMLPVSTRLGGRFAGVHIQPDGRVEVHPLPPGVVELIRGGPFALARADDGAATYHETTDGGRTFRPVVAPPVGELNAPYDANMIQGCSELGCALGDGVVRLGWGSPAPAAPQDTPADIAPAPEPPVKRLGSLPLRCRLERPGAPAPRGDSKTDAGPAPLPASLRIPPGVAVGLVRAGSFTVDVGLPFDPRPPRRAAFKAPSLSRVEGSLVPVLLATDASPVGLFLRTTELRFDLGLPGSPNRDPVPLQHNGAFTAAADLGRGDLLTLQAGDGELSLLRGGLLRRLTQIARVPDVTRHRLGLARRRGDAASPRLAVSAVSGTSGDILLADLDITRATLGPVRAAGSLTNLDASPACRPDPDAYRLLADVLVDVQFDPPDPDHDAPSLGATALVAVSTGRTCLEGLEVRLPRNNATLVVRFPSPGVSLLRAAGRSDAAICSSP